MSAHPLTRGVATANGLDFHYLEAGSGPLALCLHGFPDSPFTWRHVLPALAAAGYRAVAPWMRGYAPTAVPATPAYGIDELGRDANALHAALGGDGRAVLIGHDWGALTTYAAAASGPWRRCVAMSVPPLPVFGQSAFSYAQVKRSFYFWFFQMRIAPLVVAGGDLAFIDGLWADWSPGHDAGDDLPHVKAALGTPANVDAALGYYRANVAADSFGLVAPEQPVLAQPLLYLHGRRDGCIALDEVQMSAVETFGAAGSRSAWIDGAGHFLTVEQPDAVNRLLLDFLGRA